MSSVLRIARIRLRRHRGSTVLIALLIAMIAGTTLIALDGAARTGQCARASRGAYEVGQRIRHDRPVDGRPGRATCIARAGRGFRRARLARGRSGVGFELPTCRSSVRPTTDSVGNSSDHGSFGAAPRIRRIRSTSCSANSERSCSTSTSDRICRCTRSPPPRCSGRERRAEISDARSARSSRCMSSGSSAVHGRSTAIRRSTSSRC